MIQRFLAGLLAWLGLILGLSVGQFLDQAANLPFDGRVMPALRACHNCLAAVIPVAAEVVKVNRFTLLGSILGQLAGVFIAALRPANQDRDCRQAEALEQRAAETTLTTIEPVVTTGDAVQRAPVAASTSRPRAAEPIIASTPLPADRAAAVRPTQSPAWRRLALPAGATLLALCLAGAAIANGGTIKQAASGWLGGAAANPTSVASPAITVHPTLQASTLAPTATQPATPLPASATPKPTDPATALPAASPLPTVSPTAPLPPDVIGLATVVLPNDIVGRLRDGPNGQVIGGVPGNMLVYVLSGRQTTNDGIVWVPIRLPKTGQSGWFAESLLEYTATPVP